MLNTYMPICSVWGSHFCRFLLCQNLIIFLSQVFSTYLLFLFIFIEVAPKGVMLNQKQHCTGLIASIKNEEWVVNSQFSSALTKVRTSSQHLLAEIKAIHGTWYTSIFFKNNTFLFDKIKSWDFQHLFDTKFQFIWTTLY